MLTIEERITDANNKIVKAKQQQKQKQRQERETQTKKDQRQNYIIGELFAEYFPIIRTLEPGTTAENEVRFQPLKLFLSELASDQELVKIFTEMIQNRDEETIHSKNKCS